MINVLAYNAKRYEAMVSGFTWLGFVINNPMSCAAAHFPRLFVVTGHVGVSSAVFIGSEKWLVAFLNDRRQSRS